MQTATRRASGALPNGLYDFDQNARLWYLVRRSGNGRTRVVWSPARWQNVILTSFGALALVGFYVLPAMHWDEIREADVGALVLFGLVVAVLFVPIVAMMGMGLFHWPRLILDMRDRSLIVRRRFSRKIDIALRLDDVLRLEIADLTDDSGGEVSGPFRVLYAQLKDGRQVSLAVEPSDEFVAELRALV
jgi:hypothetical protein